MADAVVIIIGVVVVAVLVRTRGRVPPGRRARPAERPSGRARWAGRLEVLGLGVRIVLAALALVLIALVADRLSS